MEKHLLERANAVNAEINKIRSDVRAFESLLQKADREGYLRESTYVEIHNCRLPLDVVEEPIELIIKGLNKLLEQKEEEFKEI